MTQSRRQTDIGDEAVRRATGFPWSHWFQVLDTFDVATNGHRAAAQFVHEQCGLNGWWSQSVVVRYEQERGLRDKLQKADGYAVSASRTITAAIEGAYAIWSNARRRKGWLTTQLTLRTAQPNKSLRFRGEDGRSIVEVNFYAKNSGKCQVVVQHSKLKSSREAARWKRYWSGAMDRLRERLEK